jgi:predicted permease
MTDLRYAIRFALRNRGLALMVCLTLTLAIGAATAMFAIGDAVLWNPLPVPEPDRVVAVWEIRRDGEAPRRTVSAANVASWMEGGRSFEAIGVYRDWGMQLRGPNGPEPIYGAIASPELFAVLGARPVLGRTFSASDDRPGPNAVIVISHRLWRTRFGSDPDVVGRPVTLARAPTGPRVFTIVGVLGPDVLPSLSAFEFWAPASIDPDYGAGRGRRNRRALGRLAPGATIDSALADLRQVAERLEREHADSNAGWSVAMTSLTEAELGDVRPTLVLFSSAIAMLVLIGCANVAGLLLARAMGRTRELAIRVAVGATRRRIVRLLLTESLLLSTAGALGGALAAGWLLVLFERYGPAVPRGSDISIDLGAWGCAAALAAVTGLLSGLAPAIHLARWGASESVRAGGPSAFRWPAVRLRSALIAAEMALALVLMVGAALGLRSLNAMLATPLGIDPDDVLVFQVFPSAAAYPERAHLVPLYARIADDLRRLPGVASVGAASAGPLFGGEETDRFTIEGIAPGDPRERPQARYFDVDAAYFSTMGMRLIAGRTFETADSMATRPVVVINEAFARRYLPNGAIGRRIAVEQRDLPLEIVGVVSDLRHGLDPALPVVPEMYWPQSQLPRWATYFVVRTTTPPSGVAPAVRDVLRRIDPEIVPARVTTVEQLIQQASRRPRFQSALLALFAIFAAVLCTTGLYGLVSYAVGQRTREIALRVSLGASRASIVRLVLIDGATAALLGMAVGLAGAAVFVRSARSLLVGVSAADPASFAAAGALLLGATLLACLSPVRRALGIDPATALRSE